MTVKQFQPLIRGIFLPHCTSIKAWYRSTESNRSCCLVTLSRPSRPSEIKLRPISCSAFSSLKMSSASYMFGPYKIDPKEVFYVTDLSYALVNLRPLLPDVLVCPRRVVKRFGELSADEASDLWLTAQKVGSGLEEHYKASSLTFAIQDGPHAGQTVAHVHVHIIPRKVGDFEKNDEIYDAIDAKEKELAQKLDLDKERKDRSLDEMAAEADQYRALFSSK